MRSVLKKWNDGASLVAQWLRICLPMQGTRVRALVWEDPTCRGATRPVSHNYWACASGACAPQQERLQQWEAHAPRWRGAPACHNWRKPSHRNEDPTQPKINKFIKKKKSGMMWWYVIWLFLSSLYSLQGQSQVICKSSNLVAFFQSSFSLSVEIFDHPLLLDTPLPLLSCTVFSSVSYYLSSLPSVPHFLSAL